MDLSDLPSVSRLLDHDAQIRAAVDRLGHAVVAAAVRSAVDDARTRVLAGDAVTAEAVADAALARLGRSEQARVQPVINATGVILHTNLGRAPLSAAATAAGAATAGYAAVEYDLEHGDRGRRGARLRELAATLTGAEDAVVVNNGAAALVLVLAALAGGREVVCSRGELIEIGGSFRLPDMIAASGVTLREVGTTNRTRVGDYAAVVGSATAALLTVHPSNYRVSGFTERPVLGELVGLAHDVGVPLVHDLGSGLLEEDAELLPGEPGVRASMTAGVDLAIFSGDKLLGGPQAGFVVGRADLVARCAAHPLARVVRLDKQRIAALEATLEAHLRNRRDELPTWRALQADVVDLERRARDVATAVGGQAVHVAAVVGGGTTPGVTLPSWGVALPGDADHILAALRRATPPVIGRRVDDRAALDLRAVNPDLDAQLVAVISAVLETL
jgi:L-seryl-tRNA(Ser) seleniumtransferase